MRISDWSSDVCSSDLRALDDGDIVRISRGLYQDPQSDVDSEQTLAEVAKRIPKGVIAMVSALAYHGLTDQMPRKTWVAIGARDWSPVSDYQIGRASCRERVCQYVSISVGAVELKKK